MFFIICIKGETGGYILKKFYYRYLYKSKKIIGIAMAIIGFLIVVKFIPVELILFLIGIALLIMAGLILKIK